MPYAEQYFLLGPKNCGDFALIVRSLSPACTPRISVFRWVQEKKQNSSLPAYFRLQEGTSPSTDKIDHVFGTGLALRHSEFSGSMEKILRTCDIGSFFSSASTVALPAVVSKEVQISQRRIFPSRYVAQKQKSFFYEELELYLMFLSKMCLTLLINRQDLHVDYVNDLGFDFFIFVTFRHCVVTEHMRRRRTSIWKNFQRCAKSLSRGSKLWRTYKKMYELWV